MISLLKQQPASAGQAPRLDLLAGSRRSVFDQPITAAGRSAPSTAEAPATETVIETGAVTGWLGRTEAYRTGAARSAGASITAAGTPASARAGEATGEAGADAAVSDMTNASPDAPRGSAPAGDTAVIRTATSPAVDGAPAYQAASRATSLAAPDEGSGSGRATLPPAAVPITGQVAANLAAAPAPAQTMAPAPTPAAAPASATSAGSSLATVLSWLIGGRH